MIMGIIILKKTYTIDKYLSVMMITLGIVICTMESGKEIKSTAPITANTLSMPWNDFFWWAVGISLLTIALFISARMGIYQETLFSRYGKNPREALYYTVCILLLLFECCLQFPVAHYPFFQHLLPLPFFTILSMNLWEHAVIAMNSPRIVIPVLDFSMPRMIAYLIGNILTQYPLKKYTTRK